MYTKSPGYTAVTRGEVIYLIQCKAIKVKVISSENCYQELVVKDTKNSTRYVKPSTRIIVDMGTEIECSTMLPPMYNVDGTWIRVGSEITIPIPPEELSAQPKLNWQYGNMVTLNKLGILSDKQLSQYRTAIISPLEQNSILTSFSRKVGSSIEYNGHIEDFSSAINTSKLTEDISNNLLYKIYGWWEFVIRHLSGIVGFAILWNILVALCSCVINIVLLYKRFGFSSILLFSIWSAMTKHIILYGDILKSSQKEVDGKNNRVTNSDRKTEDQDELTEIASSLYPNLIKESAPLDPSLLNTVGNKLVTIK